MSNQNEKAVPPAPAPLPTQTDQVLPTQLDITKQRRNNLQGLLHGYTNVFKQALPKFLTPEKMIRVAMTAMLRTPKLMECTDISIISSLLTCAQLGLVPDSILGEAYLIPFNNTKKGVMECTVIPGYKGLSALAMRSGQVKSVQPRAVFQGDQFEYEFGLNEKLVHKPMGETNQNKITHFYAIIHLSSGGHLFDVMSRKEVEAIRNESSNYKYSKDQSSTIWTIYFKDMGCKTVLRRLLKYTTLSPELQRAIGLDEAAEMGKQNTVPEIADLMGKDNEFTDYTIEGALNEQGEEKENDKNKKAAEAAERGKDAAQSTLNLLNEKDNKKV